MTEWVYGAVGWVSGALGSSVTVTIPWSVLWLALAYAVYYRWLCAPPRLYGAQSPLNQRLLSARYSLGGVLSAYRPPWYMPHGHVQNAYTFVAQQHFPRLRYARERLRVDALQVGRYPGTVALDWALPLRDPAQQTGPVALPLAAGAESPYRDDTPTVMLFHGLTGGSAENYIRAVAHALMQSRPGAPQGYRCVVMNARGCGGTRLVSPQAFCAWYTDDMRQAVAHVARRLPRAPLLGVGFSLGANVLTKYVAEEGAACPLTAAIAVSTPFDLVLNSRALDRSAFAHHFYHRVLGRNLVRLLSMHAPMLRAAEQSQGIDLSLFGSGLPPSSPSSSSSQRHDALLDAEAVLSALPEIEAEPEPHRQPERASEADADADADVNGNGNGHGDGATRRAAKVYRTASGFERAELVPASYEPPASKPCSAALGTAVWVVWSLLRVAVALLVTAVHAVTGTVAWVWRDLIVRVLLRPAIDDGSTSGAVARACGQQQPAPPLTVRVFDELITRRSFGFRSVDEYYRASSTNLGMMSVGGGRGVGVGTGAADADGSTAPATATAPAAVPTTTTMTLADTGATLRRPHTTHLLAVNSLDDPIVSAESLPYDECGAHNPDHTLLVTTRTGSHSMLFYERSPDVLVPTTATAAANGSSSGTTGATTTAIPQSSYPPGSWLSRVAVAYFHAALSEMPAPQSLLPGCGVPVAHPPPLPATGRRAAAAPTAVSVGASATAGSTTTPAVATATPRARMSVTAVRASLAAAAIAAAAAATPAPAGTDASEPVGGCTAGIGQAAAATTTGAATTASCSGATACAATTPMSSALCVTDELLDDIRQLNALLSRNADLEQRRADAITSRLSPATERVAQRLLTSTPKRVELPPASHA